MAKNRGHNYLGKEHTQEWKEAQKKWISGNTFNRGSVWMNDGVENKRIKEIEVYAWEVDGWVQGRMPLVRSLTAAQKEVIKFKTDTFNQELKALKNKFKELNDRQRYLIDRLEKYEESLPQEQAETMKVEIHLIDSKIKHLIEQHLE